MLRLRSGRQGARLTAGLGATNLVSMRPAELVILPGREPPPGVAVGLREVSRGIALRVARWDLPAEVEPRGTILICTGRGEAIEKYFEVVGDLLRRRFAVTVFDWRGQGRSSRARRHAPDGHIGDFADFDADLAAVIRGMREAGCPRPFFGLAHSMGGTVMLRHARTPACAFDRIVLSAPMIAIDRLPAVAALHWLSRALVAVGLGTRAVPSGKRTAILVNGFPDNVLTSDPGRFADMMAVSRAEPGLTVGAPTLGWLRAALSAMAPFESFDYPARLAVPILMVVPGRDRVVSVAAMERFGRRLKAGTVVVIPESRHEIMMERDNLREQFWAAFDAFIPGTAAAAPSRSAARGIASPEAVAG